MRTMPWTTTTWTITRMTISRRFAARMTAVAARDATTVGHRPARCYDCRLRPGDHQLGSTDP